jgi:hypothetical protein
MQERWTPNQIKYIDWLATPRYSRTPPTQELFADECGLNPSTLWRWQKLDGFRAAVTARAREMVGDALPNIYGALVDKADRGDVPAIKLVLELTGEYTQRQEVSGPDGGPMYVVRWDEPANDTD